LEHLRSKRPKRADFLRLIGNIMNRSDGQVTARVVHKSSQRAQDYMIAYSLIKKGESSRKMERNKEISNMIQHPLNNIKYFI
jgi:hypothetical protein